MKRAAFAVAALMLVGPASASNPGEPLDCSDFVFLEQGFYCVAIFAGDANLDLEDPNLFGSGVSTSTISNQGWFLRFRSPAGTVGHCPPGGGGLQRNELVSFLGADIRVLAHIDERCLPAGGEQKLQVGGPVTFDKEAGRLLFWAYNTCVGETEPCPERDYLLAIGGFTTTFEILQTYEPTASTFGFRVPYMPEGFQYASFFDTYYGDLATVGDWSQAQPLECGYPASAPQVGDYLTVADTVPDPPPGQGYYFVTAVNYQGQRRYGRKATNGVLSGRDPAVLPGCAKQ